MIWGWRNRSEVNHVSGDIQFIAAFLPRRRTISTFHDCERLQHQKGWRRAVFKWLWITMPFSKSLIVTAVSQRTKLDLIDETGCAPDKIRIIENPVSQTFVPGRREFCAKKPRLLQIGTRANKNLPRVIEAISGLPCTLVIVGAPSADQATLLAQFGIEHEIHTNVSDDEMVRLYQGADIVVFVSLFEGFGLVAIEAQACGKPLLTSIGVPFDHVVGSSACCVDPYSASEIRQGIERIIEDDEYRENLVKLGVTNAQRYSARNIASQYMELYKEIANGTRQACANG
jgi:glycosyltransferase involved in cell wall biosynthesis